MCWRGQALLIVIRVVFLARIPRFGFLVGMEDRGLMRVDGFVGKRFRKWLRKQNCLNGSGITPKMLNLVKSAIIERCRI